MTTVEELLDGLEAELALERELGVRAVECDRALLAGRVVPGAPQVQREDAASVRVPPRQPSAPPSTPPLPPATTNQTIKQANNQTILPFVFLHHRPLAGTGAEMIAKITAAMGATPATAPVVTNPPLPPARVYIVLGGNALKRFFPNRPASPGQWLNGERGADILVTYSPDYILRFSPGSAPLQKVKGEMWRSLKGVLQRLALAAS